MMLTIATLATLLLLCVLPVLLVVLFRETIAERKQNTILEELHRLRAFDLPVVQRKGGEEGITQAIQDVYGRRFLFPPAVLLSMFYLPGFLLCDVLLKHVFGYALNWPTPALVEKMRPVAFAFSGVYLFNLGSMVRRLYLSDLTEHVFWGSINRLLLSIGVAFVLASGDLLHQSNSLFFAIGFLANAFLQGVLQAGLRLGKISRARSEDLPLQLVRGINIWKEYRLEEEGIEEIQNLATADPIDLAVKTHYGLRALIDWIDQAVVIQRLGKEKSDKLWQLGVPVSAIDFAWQSPENSGHSTNSDTLAASLGMEPLFMANLMNSLYEDAFVQILWALWQTRVENKEFPELTAA
jgi:hypothetical protein